jgi:hypothetical protein
VRIIKVLTISLLIYGLYFFIPGKTLAQTSGGGVCDCGTHGNPAICNVNCTNNDQTYCTNPPSCSNSGTATFVTYDECNGPNDCNGGSCVGGECTDGGGAGSCPAGQQSSAVNGFNMCCPTGSSAYVTSETYSVLGEHTRGSGDPIQACGYYIAPLSSTVVAEDIYEGSDIVNRVLYVCPIYGCTSVTTSSQPTGDFMAASCSNFYGWTCDEDSYSTPLDVHFYKDGPVVKFNKKTPPLLQIFIPKRRFLW